MKPLMKKLIPLSRLASVNRGIATGANNYFVLTPSEAKKWKIEEEFLVPVISSSQQARHFDYTQADYERDLGDDVKTLLLYCFDAPKKNLQGYVKYGETLGIDKRYLPAHRSPWFSSEKQNPAPILACVFSRDRMRFVLNAAGVRNLTSFHGIYPKFSDQTCLKAMLSFLNSETSLKVQALMRREYGGGLHKFEPRDLEKLLVLDINDIPTSARARLAELFDELAKAKRRNELEAQEVKLKIDQELLRLLGT